MVEMAVNSIKGGPSVAGPDEEDILYSRMNNSRYLIGVVLMIIIVSTVSQVYLLWLIPMLYYTQSLMAIRY
jgi:hypothetical protein